MNKTGTGSGVGSKWINYWFPDAPLLDLAILRIIVVGLQLGLMLFDPRYGLENLRIVSEVPEAFYRPLYFYQAIVAVVGHPLTLSEVQTLQIVTVIIGFFAFAGLFTRISMFLFAAGAAVIQLWILSHGDVHHPEAAMIIGLALLAFAPCGRVLSLDALRGKISFHDQLQLSSHEAKWPILVMQWFFGMMYLSAFWAKLWIGNFQWANGFTLQYYMAGDGYRWDPLLGIWLSQFHWLAFLGQWFILFFQGTFFVSLLVPKLKWFYVPIGMAMHIGIYLMLKAPFFQWMALYFVFVPWTAVFIKLGWISASEDRELQLARASAGPKAA